MMDLDDGVESTPGLTDTHPGRSMAPFLGVHHHHQHHYQQTTTLPPPPQRQQQSPPDKQLPSQQQQQQPSPQQQHIQLQNGYKQSAMSVTTGGSTLTHRHNNALAVSIETDV